jgi:hypothetical protein
MAFVLLHTNPQYAHATCFVTATTLAGYLLPSKIDEIIKQRRPSAIVFPGIKRPRAELFAEFEERIPLIR